MKIILIWISFLFLGVSLYAQDISELNFKLNNNKAALFFENEEQVFGFDQCESEAWLNEYENWKPEAFERYLVAVKSVGALNTDKVNVELVNFSSLIQDSLSFKVEGSDNALSFFNRSKNKYTLTLPQRVEDYTLYAWYQGEKIGKLYVKVLAVQKERIILVPLENYKINRDSVAAEVQKIAQCMNIKVVLEWRSPFEVPQWNKKELFANPSPNNERFTDQMRELRDLYLSHKSAIKNDGSYYFIIPGFVNEQITGYSVKGKTFAFVKKNEAKTMARAIMRQLAITHGRLSGTWLIKGPEKASTSNLLDIGTGVQLRSSQWKEIRTSPRVYSVYDDYEDVKTNSGIVGFYFWKENKYGSIQLPKGDLLSAIKRPYKKNQFSVHLNISNFFYHTLFKVKQWSVCSLHLIGVVLSLAFSFYIGRKWIRFIRSRGAIRIIRFLFRCAWIGVFIVLTSLTVVLVNKGYQFFQVKGGKVYSLENKSTREAIYKIRTNVNWLQPQQEKVASQLLIHRNRNWYLKKRSSVLYFDLYPSKESDTSKLEYTTARFNVSKDTLVLHTKGIKQKSESHYIVARYLDLNGKIKAEKVYNHMGVDLTDKLSLSNPAKRILLFVNGYRPTSLGQTFEENFSDIQNKGLEFPTTNNMIYLFDRYNYWHPWNSFDSKFIERLNPGEVFYADGHHSVSTSNHQSLINFTTLSTSYPKRCKNPKRHTCYRYKKTGLFGTSEIKTQSLLPTIPNRSGFNERYENGKIAGKNLIQLLNEIPNKSANDTLYLVAHSMGFAYAMGLVDEVRGKIHFGGLYIIAPENASLSEVKKKEWTEVWQYGSDFSINTKDKPCMQDGVAPQAKAGGLSDEDRVYIPKQFYTRRGFFDSHFIGYYTWIFDIPKGENGSVKQR